MPSDSESFFSLFDDTTSLLEFGIFLTGGAEQTGTTDLIRTAGAMKAGGTPRSNLSGGLGEHEATPVLILGGAAQGEAIFCGLNPSDEVGFTVLVLTGAAADKGGTEYLYWGPTLDREESTRGFCN